MPVYTYCRNTFWFDLEKQILDPGYSMKVLIFGRYPKENILLSTLIYRICDSVFLKIQK